MTIRTPLLLIAVAILIPSVIVGEAVAQDHMGQAIDFLNDDGRSMSYRFLEPATTPDAENQVPLVVFLHGAGERGTDNEIQMRVHIDGLRAATQTADYGSYLIAPQLPRGNTFWHPNEAYDLTKEIIDDVVANHPVDPSRIYVTGLSLGGNGSFNYISEFPEFFAAAVPMSGWGDRSSASTIADIPIWTFHGDSDGTVGVSGSRDMYFAVDEVGGAALHSDIRFGGHVIWSPIYSDWESDAHGLYPWLFAQSTPAKPARQLINESASWAFLDDGTDAGTEWRELEFNDSAWPLGVGQFGYGENDTVTVVNCGPNAPDCGENNFPTTYFRHSFHVDRPEDFVMVSAEILRDDAAAVYLNGTEIFRDSTLPSDATFDAYAGNGENSMHGWIIDSSLLKSGENVVAVEVHQRRTTDGDASFDFRMYAQVPEPATGGLFWLAAAVAIRCRRKN